MGKISILIRILAVQLLLIQGLPSIASPENNFRCFYFNVNGKDNNSGSFRHPFKSLEKLRNIALRPGDKIYLRGGQIFHGSIQLDSLSIGNKIHPIHIESYGKNKAIIDAKDSLGIKLYEGAYIIIENLRIQGSGRKSGNLRDGICIKKSHHISLKRLEISGFQKSGVFVFASHHIQINHIRSFENGSAGITVEGPYGKRESHDIKILNSRAENNPGDPSNLKNHSGNGIVVGNCKNVLIDHCTATNNGWDMPRKGNGPVGIWAYEADYIIIQHCLSYLNKTSVGGWDGGGFDLDGGVTHSLIQYCFSYKNQGAGYCIFQYSGAKPWHDNIFRFNISEDDGNATDSKSGLYIWNSSMDENQLMNCQVYGNIIFNSLGSAICFSETSKCKGIVFGYNVFVAKDSLIKGEYMGETQFWNNDWWSLEKGFHSNQVFNMKNWAKKTGKEIRGGILTGLNKNPEFLNPGKSHLNSANQLSSFKNYLLSPNSILRSKPVFKNYHGIRGIKL